MYSVTKRIDFCYGHRLLDYDGVCKHPHGHNAVAEIEVRADALDRRNMVVDFTDIKQRGVADILIAVVDGLRGFPEAIEAVFPRTQIQTCIVHLIRNSLNFVAWKYRKALATELKSHMARALKSLP